MKKMMVMLNSSAGFAVMAQNDYFPQSNGMSFEGTISTTVWNI